MKPWVHLYGPENTKPIRGIPWGYSVDFLGVNAAGLLALRSRTCYRSSVSVLGVFSPCTISCLF